MILNTEIIIVGLGKSGYATAQYFRAKKQPFMVMDSREKPALLKQFKAEFPDIQLSLGELNQAQLCQAKTLILAPGLAKSLPEIQAAIKAGVEVIGDIELLMRETQNKAVKTILITGSNGKTTVTSLIEAMAKKAGLNAFSGGNIGRPALDLLNEKAADLYILECSSFQLETTPNIHSDAATVLNITPDHMDRYDDLNHYARIKRHIYQQATCCVVNRDDPATFQDLNAAQMVGFSLEKENSQDGDFYLQDNQLQQGEQVLITTDQIKMIGQHQYANALAALALVDAVGIDQQAALDTLKTFSGLTHRTEFVREINQVRWINDSKATNIGACQAAIKSLGAKNKRNIILLAGGQGKDADFSELIEPISQHVHHVILFGEDSEKIADALNNKCGLIRAISLDEAVNHAAEIAEAGDLILLSPACASFDLFDGFEHRGDCFMEAVWRLPQ